MSELADEVRKMCLNLSDRAFDPVAKDIVRKWSPEPTAAQVLEALDMCVHGSLCSSFEIKVLHMLYEQACKAEGKTHDQVASEATWRLRARR
jgi:hypothetical protein